MYPNLRYAVYDLFGADVPALGLVQSYGFFLAFAFLVSGVLLTIELKRRQELGWMKGIEETSRVGDPLSFFDIFVNGLLGFIIGFKGIYAAQNPGAFAGNDAKTVLMSLSHGNWIGGIALAAIFVGWKYWDKQQELKQHPQPEEIRKDVFPHERVSDMVILAALSGIFGAKMLYLMEYPQEFRQDPIGSIFSGSGLTVYGGLITAFFVVAIYARRKQISVLQLMDAVAPILMLAYGVGRLGCHFSGDGDWGDPNPYEQPSWLPDWLWAYQYPNNVISEGPIMTDCGGYPVGFGDYCSQLEAGVFPTAVYEFFLASIIFVVLWGLRKRLKIAGMLFFVYLIFNGLERFSIEMIRINNEYSVFGINMTQAQSIAIVLFLIGVVGAFLLSRFGREPEIHNNYSEET